MYLLSLPISYHSKFHSREGLGITSQEFTQHLTVQHQECQNYITETFLRYLIKLKSLKLISPLCVSNGCSQYGDCILLPWKYLQPCRFDFSNQKAVFFTAHSSYYCTHLQDSRITGHFGIVVLTAVACSIQKLQTDRNQLPGQHR